MQIARWIEEVRAQEVAPETGREAFRYFGERDAAGVGGEDRIGFASGFDFAPQRTLDLEIFDDGFDNPIAVRELREIVLEVARFDQRGFVIGKESTGPLFQGVLNALQRGRAALGLSRYIQKQGWDAGVGEMRRDARAHGACAENGNTMNISHVGTLQIHSAHVLLGIACSGRASLGKQAIDFLELGRSQRDVERLEILL